MKALKRGVKWGVRKMLPKFFNSLVIFGLVLQPVGTPGLWRTLVSAPTALAADEEAVTEVAPAEAPKEETVAPKEETVTEEAAISEEAASDEVKELVVSEVPVVPDTEEAVIEETTTNSVDSIEAPSEEVVIEETAPVEEAPAVEETVVPAENVVPVEETVAPAVEGDSIVSDEKAEESQETDVKEVSVTEETTKEVEAVPAAPLSEQVCLSASVSGDSETSWTVDGDKAVTNDVVELGVRYVFPLDKEVTVTFTCLPADESKRAPLSIERIKSSEINLPDGTVAVSEYAYDITTDGMDNGDFKYDLTLPKSTDEDVTLSYIEKSADEVKGENLSQDDVKEVDKRDVDNTSDSVEATDLDHFTVFLISASTNATTGTGVYTSTTGPSITESAVGQISTGTLILNAPSGFQFNTAANSVTATVTNGSCPVGGNKPIEVNAGSGGGLSSVTVTPTASQITINVKQSSTGIGSCAGTITWSGIQTRPTVAVPLASGDITLTGTIGGATFDTNTFTEVGSDTTAPTITNVSSDKTNGSYKAGEVIDIDVTFSEVVTSTGNVTVTLETGATDRTCTFTVTNSTTGTCNYTVQAGDTSADLTVASISGTIADQAANAMADFAPATNLAANKALVIDTTVPVVAVDLLATNDTKPELTGMVDDTTATIQVTVDGHSYAATNNENGTWTLADNTINPALSDGAYDVAVTATDSALNVGTDETNNELVINTSALAIATYDATLTTLDSEFLQGETVGVKAEGLTSFVNKWYRLDIVEPDGLTKHPVASCSNNISTMSGTYALSGGAEASSSWKSEITEYTNNSNCTAGTPETGIDSQTFTVLAIAPIITAEASSARTANSITISWTTDHPSTSRVVYGTAPVSDVDSAAAGAPNYGYPNSTVEDSTLVTSHSVTVTGLSSGTTYYFRPVSHGSPETVGDEVVAETISACNGSSFDGFSLGSVNGQGGWSATGPFDQDIVDNVYGFPDFGCKTLRVSNAVTSGSFGDQIFAAPVTNAAGEVDATAGSFSEGTRQNHFEAQFDIASTMSGEQSGMFTSISPDRGDGSRMSYLSFADTPSGIDVTFYDVQNSGPAPQVANFVPTNLGTLSRTATHTIKFEMDFVDGPGNDVVKIYIDGSLIHEGTSWEDYYRYDPEASAEQSPRLVKTLLIRESGTSVSGNDGNGFLFDNFDLSSSTVTPAPGSIEITKYLCPNGTTVNRTDNGVGGSTPAGCAVQSGAYFGYVHGAQSDTGSPYPEWSASVTAGGSTDGSGILSITNLVADGRYVVFETDSSNNKLADGDVLGLYCEGDLDPNPNHNDNGDITFVPSGGATHCVAYNEAPADTQAPDVPTHLTPADGAYLTSANLTSIDWSTVTDASSPVSYFYQSSMSSATNPDGSFVSPAYSSSALSASEIPALGTPEGTYYWHVKACDSLGNCSDWSGPWELFVDSTAPSVPINGTPHNTTLATNEFDFDWDDSTDANAITYDYQTSQNPASVGGVLTTGLWTANDLPTSMIHSSGAGNGTWYWQVRAKDAAGNYSAWSEIWNMTIDTTAPVLAQVTPVASLTNDSTPSYTFSSSEAGTIAYGGSCLSVTTSAVAGNNMITFDVLADGEYSTCTITVTDAVSNASDPLTVSTFTVDTTAPDVEITSPAAGFVAGNVDIRGSVTDVNPHHYYLVIRNASNVQVAGPGTVNDSSSFTDQFFFTWDTTSVVDGTYTVRLEARDAANNKDAGSVDVHTVTVDNTAPTADLVFSGTGPGVTSFDVVFSEDVKEAEAENPANYFLTNWPGAGGSGDLVGDATVIYNSGTYTATVQFTTPGWYVSPEQTWGVQNVHDLAGNLLAVSPYSETSTPMVDPVTTDDTDSSWHNSDVTITLSCSDVDGSGCKTTYYTTNGDTPTVASSTGNSVVVSAEGETVIKYFSVDNAGNEEEVQTAANTVKIDKTVPVVDAGTDKITDSDFSQDATATDALSGIATYAWSKVSGPGAVTFGTPAAEDTTVSVDTIGNYVLRLTVTDNAGNVASDDFTKYRLSNFTAHKWNDFDASGIKEEDEMSLSDWQMELYLGSSCEEESSLGTMSTDENGNATFAGLLPGEYSIKESVEEGWRNITPLCQSVTLTAGEDDMVSFGNQELGTITINKLTNDVESDEVFFFTPSYGDVFTLVGNGGSNFSGFLVPGTYTITEQEKGGWELDNLTCVDNAQNSTSVVLGATATITLGPGNDVTCTYANDDVKDDSRWWLDGNGGGNGNGGAAGLIAGAATFNPFGGNQGEEGQEEGTEGEGAVEGAQTENSQNGQVLGEETSETQTPTDNPSWWWLWILVLIFLGYAGYRYKTSQGPLGQ